MGTDPGRPDGVDDRSEETADARTRKRLIAAGAVVFVILVFVFGGGSVTDSETTTTTRAPGSGDVIVSGPGQDAGSDDAEERAEQRDVADGEQGSASVGSGSDPDCDSATGAEEPSSLCGAAVDDAPVARYSDLPTITLDELPREALDVLEAIENGGPYRYRQDDGVFQNREGILPDRPRGHYREYTVDTPGSRDRGARRIVSGADGERYWTDDHYASFSEIVF